MKNNFSIITAKTGSDFSEAKVLFLEYAKELNVDLCFQDFNKELQEISSIYNSPSGILLLLKNENSFIGCIGLRKTSDEISEMKRMYIKKEFRGKGLSRNLISKLFSFARKMNYKSVRLDTLPQMKEAISLYQSLGFKETTPYRFNPVEGTKYMELKFE